MSDDKYYKRVYTEEEMRDFEKQKEEFLELFYELLTEEQENG